MKGNSCTARTLEGFSLVETALALLIIAVGLLGVISLFVVGLDLNNKSIRDTHRALFAEYVMNGFRALAEVTDWDKVKEGNPDFKLTPPTYYTGSGGGMWADQQDKAMQVVPGDTAGAGIQLTFRPLEDPDIEEMTYRYEVRIQDISDNRKSILLTTWDGYSKIKRDVTTTYMELYRRE